MIWSAERREILKHARKAQQTIAEKLERPFLDAARAKIGHDPSCGACLGPYHCCRMLVVTSLLDGIPIAERVLASDDPDLSRNLAEQAEHQRAISREVAGGIFYDRHEVCSAWWDRNEPCVFLRNDRCVVYDVRPMPCRMHMAFSDPRCCGGADREHLLTVDPGITISVEHLFWAKKLELDLGMQHTGLPYTDVLAAVVGTALDALRSNTAHRFRRVLGEASAQGMQHPRTSGSSPTG